jgi:hypothetical protein
MKARRLSSGCRDKAVFIGSLRPSFFWRSIMLFTQVRYWNLIAAPYFFYSLFRLVTCAFGFIEKAISACWCSTLQSFVAAARQRFQKIIVGSTQCTK